MKNQYALHKKFINDVNKYVSKNDLEKLIIFTINFLSLRQVHSDEISNRDLLEVVKKISTTDYEVLDLYQNFMNELTSQEFTFRIKRIKYIKNTRDSICIVASPMLQKVGKYLMEFTTPIPMFDIEEPEKQEENLEKKSVEKNETIAERTLIENETGNKETHKEENGDLKYLKSIYSDPKKRLEWLLNNMKYTNKKYGHTQNNGYTAEEIGKYLGKNPLTIKHYVRRYLVENSKKH